MYCRLFLTLSATLTVLLTVTCWLLFYTRAHTEEAHGTGNNSETGNLFLTPYLNSHRLEAGRKASLVTGLPGLGLTSYSGLFTVDECCSFYFFWFFPAQTQAASAPVLLWLQGGPGFSSLQGLLYEHGPIGVRKPGEAHKDINQGPKLGIPLEGREVFLRDITWNKEFSMLYIDNPLGTGYSYSDIVSQEDDQLQGDYTRRLYSAVTQFFQLFPDYAGRDFYIGGQSYAGKFVTALAHHIHIMNPSVDQRLNLRGIYLGAGFCDPKTMLLSISDYVYSWGAFTKYERDVQKQRTSALFEIAVERLGNMSKNDAFTAFWDTVPTTIFPRSRDNILDGKFVDRIGIDRFLNSALVKRALHVSNTSEIDRPTIGKDYFLSTKHAMSVILDNYKVLFYNGNLDMIVNTLGIEDFLLSTSWSGQEQYSKASRSTWCSRPMENLNLVRVNKLRGFYTHVGNLCRVVVHNAGHQTPHDQPVSSLQMVKDFVQHGCLQPPEGQTSFQCDHWVET